MLLLRILKEGSTLQEAKMGVRENLLVTVLKQWLWCPLLYTINFRCVPPKFQMAYLSFLSIVSNATVTYRVQKQVGR